MEEYYYYDIDQILEDLRSEGLREISSREELDQYLEQDETYESLIGDNSIVFVVSKTKNEYIYNVIGFINQFRMNLAGYLIDERKIYLHLKKDICRWFDFSTTLVSSYGYVYYDKKLILSVDNPQHLISTAFDLQVNWLTRFDDKLHFVYDGHFNWFRYGKWFKDESVKSYIKITSILYTLLEKNTISLTAYKRALSYLIETDNFIGNLKLDFTK